MHSPSFLSSSSSSSLHLHHQPPFLLPLPRPSLLPLTLNLLLHNASRSSHIAAASKLPQNAPQLQTKPPIIDAHRRLLVVLACCLACWTPYQPAVHAAGNSAISSPTQLESRGGEISENEATSVLDLAKVLSASKGRELADDIQTLERQTGWKLRVLTQSAGSSTITSKSLKELWKPDDRTIIVIENVSSPNILNFNMGGAVNTKLPRQFFVELQSRYGNQFFVGQEGEAGALLSSIAAIKQCLGKQDGCRNVPGLTDDLYYLTLTTSIAGGCVFGFAARLPASGRVEASWQWLLFLSPLWLLLFGSFGVLPVVGRTMEWEPLIKNMIGFLGGAAAIYLTPIFGPSPITKSSRWEEEE